MVGLGFVAATSPETNVGPCVSPKVCGHMCWRCVLSNGASPIGALPNGLSCAHINTNSIGGVPHKYLITVINGTINMMGFLEPRYQRLVTMVMMVMLVMVATGD